MTLNTVSFEKQMNDQIGAYFTYATKDNPCIVKNMNRIYQNCVNCNIALFNSIEEMKNTMSGQQSQLCYSCWNKFSTEFKEYMELGNKSTPEKKEKTLIFERIFDKFYKVSLL